MQEYGFITTLSYSKYLSTLFAQRKPNGKLRFLVDLRRVNHHIKNDYDEHNLPGTTLSDAAQHLAGKKTFLQTRLFPGLPLRPMADEQSIELLSFNFGSRTFASTRLAQGLNRSLSAFTSLVRKYLDPLVRADRCAQNADGIGKAANTSDELIEYLK